MKCILIVRYKKIFRNPELRLQLWNEDSVMWRWIKLPEKVQRTLKEEPQTLSRDRRQALPTESPFSSSWRKVRSGLHCTWADKRSGIG